MYGFRPLLLPFLRINHAVRRAIHPVADFHDRLGRHFERKIACVSMASTLGTIAIAPIWRAAMRSAVSIMQICAVHRAFSDQQNSISRQNSDAVHCTSLILQFRLIGHSEGC
jgi:hypothetical protein